MWEMFLQTVGMFNDDDWEAKQNQYPHWAAKALATPKGVGVPVVPIVVEVPLVPTYSTTFLVVFRCLPC